MASKDSLHLKRVRGTVGWSISVALLFVAVEIVFEPGQEAISVIRSATNGALFGAIFGGVHQKFITRWTQGAFVGASYGASSALIWWIAAETGMISSKPSVLPPLFSILALAAACAFAGAFLVIFSGDSKAT